jgi:hypothetical protein
LNYSLPLLRFRLGYGMYARWSTFAIGMGLALAPLLVGYQEVGPVLHDVAIGLLVCILTLAALETPALRFLIPLPAAWLVWTGRLSGDPGAGLAEVAAGALLVVAALVPRARIRFAERGRAGARV